MSCRAEDKLDLGIPGLEVVKQKDNAAKLEIDTAKHPLDRTIAAIIARNSVVDINVADVPLEEVIAEIYKRTGRQA
jgi:ABC-2 type transport system ATP-binding protein